MAYHKGLTPLRDVLATLYPAASIARVVVGDAGLSENLINFEGAAVEFWKSILTVAQSNHQIQALIDVARKHFPQNEALADAERVIHEMAGQLVSDVENDGEDQSIGKGSYIVFNHPKQRVRNQYNIAGDYIDR